MLSSLLLLVPSVLLVAPAAAAPQAIKLAPNGQVEVECMAVTETVTVYEDDIPAAPTVAVNSEKALSQLSTSTLTFTTKATTTTTVFIGATGSRIAQPAVPSVPVASVKPNVVASSGTQQPSSAPASIPPAVSPENTPRIEANQSAPAPKPGTYRNALYFTNWGIYGANFQPQQIPANQVSHILYSFADIGSDGEVKSSDSYADLQKHYPTDSWNDQGNNVYGCVKQLYLLKKKNRGMKVLLSIGGWTYSPKFPPVAATEAGRQKFASSAVKLVKDWGLDGIDIDWEYPANQAEAQNFVLLLQACRQALDAYAQQYAPGYHFIITIASPAGPSHIKDMDLEGMDPWVDAWHLMAYDYAGSWDSTSGHQANIYANGENPSATKFNTESAVRDYLVRGIPAHKISLGLPLYGRSFESTTGLGQPYNGIGQGSIQSGVWLFKDLPRNGAQEKYDDVAKASYSFDPSTNELITYDTVSSAIQKAQYLVKKGLGGAVFWEASGDKTGANSLVSTLATQMGTLDPTPNLLSYPASQYDNLRAGMTGL